MAHLQTIASHVETALGARLWLCRVQHDEAHALGNVVLCDVRFAADRDAVYGTYVRYAADIDWDLAARRVAEMMLGTATYVEEKQEGTTV